MTAPGESDTGVAMDAGEVRARLRTYQYDRLIAASLMPKTAREPLMLLAAFAAELQHTVLMVSEPMIGAIRLQWWRDSLLTALPAVPRSEVVMLRTGNPLCDALTDAARTHNWSAGLLVGIIDGIETELDATPFAETAEARQIFSKVDGSLFALSAQALGGEMPLSLRQDAGTAYAAARCAAERIARLRSGAQTYISAEMHTASTTAGAEELTNLSKDALNRVRGALSSIHEPARSALLPLATVPLYVSTAATSLRDSNGTSVMPSRLARVSRIAWARWRRRF